MNDFPDNFEFIDFHAYRREGNGETVISTIFKSEKDASTWYDLLNTEPFSFHYSSTLDNPRGEFVFKYTNHFLDYIFQIPLALDQSALDLKKAFCFEIYLVSPQNSLVPFGSPIRMAPESLN